MPVSRYPCQEVWAELAVGEKTNEIPEARTLLPTLPIAGRVCTFDALHSHRQLWNLLRLQQASPLFVIKGNESTLQADLATSFADPHAQFQQAETMDRHRGRVERRTIQVCSEICSSLHTSWPGVTHVAQLTRSRTEKGQTTLEVVYLIAILPPGSDGPQALLALSRGHWRIENSLHSVRDVTFAEDRSRLRTGHAPELLAACRNLAITLLHRSGSSQMAAARRAFSYHPRHVFDLLLARASPSNHSQTLDILVTPLEMRSNLQPIYQMMSLSDDCSACSEQERKTKMLRLMCFHQDWASSTLRASYRWRAGRSTPSMHFWCCCAVGRGWSFFLIPYG